MLHSSEYEVGPEYLEGLKPTWVEGLKCVSGRACACYDRVEVKQVVEKECIKECLE